MTVSCRTLDFQVDNIPDTKNYYQPCVCLFVAFLHCLHSKIFFKKMVADI